MKQQLKKHLLKHMSQGSTDPAPDSLSNEASFVNLDDGSTKYESSTFCQPVNMFSSGVSTDLLNPVCGGATVQSASIGCIETSLSTISGTARKLAQTNNSTAVLRVPIPTGPSFCSSGVPLQISSSFGFSGGALQTGATFSSSGAPPQTGTTFSSSGAALQIGSIFNSFRAVLQTSATFSSPGAALQTDTSFSSSGAALQSGAYPGSSGAALPTGTTFSSSGADLQTGTTCITPGAILPTSATFSSPGAALQTGTNLSIPGAALQTVTTFSSSGAALQTGTTFSSSGAALLVGTTFSSPGAALQTGTTFSSPGAALKTSATFSSSGAALQTGTTFSSSGTALQTGTIFSSSGATLQTSATFRSSGASLQTGAGFSSPIASSVKFCEAPSQSSPSISSNTVPTEGVFHSSPFAVSLQTDFKNSFCKSIPNVPECSSKGVAPSDCGSSFTKTPDASVTSHGRPPDVSLPNLTSVVSSDILPTVIEEVVRQASDTDMELDSDVDSQSWVPSGRRSTTAVQRPQSNSRTFQQFSHTSSQDTTNSTSGLTKTGYSLDSFHPFNYTMLPKSSAHSMMTNIGLATSSTYTMMTNIGLPKNSTYTMMTNVAPRISTPNFIASNDNLEREKLITDSTKIKESKSTYASQPMSYANADHIMTNSEMSSSTRLQTKIGLEMKSHANNGVKPVTDNALPTESNSNTQDNWLSVKTRNDVQFSTVPSEGKLRICIF